MNVQSPELRARVAEREALLCRLTALLREDERVAAAWLFGSLGRAEEDPLSDLDVWAVVHDEHLAGISDGRRAYAARLGEPLLLLEAPQNAPPNGAYLLALYDGEAGPHEVDWYWQSARDARIPIQARLLFDRIGLPESGLPPLVSAPGPRSDAGRTEAAAREAAFFWAMAPIAAKKIARRQPWEALGMFSMLCGTLAELGRLLDAPVDVSEPPCLSPDGQMVLLRRMAGAAAPLTPLEVRVVIPRVYRFLDLVDSVLTQPEEV